MSNWRLENKIVQRAYFDELAKIAWYTPQAILGVPSQFKTLEEAVQIRSEHEQPQLKKSNAHIKTTRPFPSVGSVARRLK